MPTAVLLLLLFSVRAFAEDVDYKTCFDVNDVTIDYYDGMYTVSSENTVLMQMKEDVNIVYATHRVCVRETPFIGSERYSILYEDQGCVQCASSDEGWRLVIFGGKYYFIWGSYLTYDDPGAAEILYTIVQHTADDEREDNGWEKLGKLRISSYCTKCNSCGARATAIGKRAVEWYCCAMNDVPLGSTVYVEGFGEFKVWDRGPKAMNGACWVDLFVSPSECDIWCKADVWIKYND